MTAPVLRLFLLLAFAGTLCTSCRQGDERLPPPPVSTQPAAALPAGLQTDEDKAKAIRFWLQQRRHDPGPARWRSLGSFASEKLAGLFEDETEDLYVRRRAVECLGYFEDPWVEAYLTKLLADRNLPDPIRVEAGRGLVNHAVVANRGEVALTPMGRHLLDGDEREDFRRALPEVMADVPGDATRDVLQECLRQLCERQGIAYHDPLEASGGSPPAASMPTGVAYATRQAVLEHQRNEERRRLLDALNLKVHATTPRFTPAPPEKQRIGIPGDDYLGDWRPPVVTVSARSEADTQRTLTIDFNPLGEPYEFVDDRRQGTSVERTETLRVAPGEQALASRKIHYEGGTILVDVWIRADGIAEPILKQRLRIAGQ